MRRNLCVFIASVSILAVALFICPAALALDTLDLSTPEKTTESMFKTMNNLDWDAFARIIDPEEIGKFKSMWIPLLTMGDSTEVARGVAMLITGNPDPQHAIALDSISFFKGCMTRIMETPNMTEALSGASMNIIGTLYEGDSLAYVVYRAQIPVAGTRVAKVDVDSLRRHQGKWYGLLRGDMEQLVAAIVRQLGE